MTDGNLQLVENYIDDTTSPTGVIEQRNSPANRVNTIDDEEEDFYGFDEKTWATTAAYLVYLQDALQDLENKMVLHIVYIDNQSAVNMAESFENSKRSRHIDIKMHFLKAVVATKLLILKYEICPVYIHIFPCQYAPVSYSKGAMMVEWLDCSPPTKANRVYSPAGPHRDFRKWELCWTMLLMSARYLASAYQTKGICVVCASTTHLFRQSMRRAKEKSSAMVASTPTTTAAITPAATLLSPSPISTSVCSVVSQLSGSSVTRAQLLCNFHHDSSTICSFHPIIS
ncbi:hypothetical protein PR048_017764 [Dryococelus australis]|uniref:Uncharacterized protein n=1 Tax=Dryococelus australis TaxID=614101 RepID=A0ABQ9HAP8_9NEOP|nr:hypothetical protein PR048_017764 [Dryococelus australis]